MNRSQFYRNLAVTGGLSAVYFVAGKLGLMIASVHPSATTIWPPTGISLAAFLLLGYGVWPGVLLGAFLVNITTMGSVMTSLSIGIGNTIEGLLGAYLVNKFANGLNAFDRAQEIFKFAVLAGITCSVSATFGVTSLSLGGFAQWINYGPVWLTWWLGDTVAALVVSPLLVLWSTNPRVSWNRDRFFEAGILMLGLVLSSQIVFCEIFSSEIKKYPLEFVCVPFLIWAAFRFGQRESAMAIFVLSGNAIWGTMQGHGPFARETQNESLLLLQAFTGTMAVTILGLAAVVSERKRLEISERRHSEQKLIRSEERFRVLVEGVKDYAIIMLDPRGQVMSWNNGAEHIKGYCTKEILGRHFSLFYEPADIQMGKPEQSLKAAATEGRFEDEGWRIRKDGSRFWANVVLTALKDETGEIQGFVKVTRDMTERKKAEQALRKSESRFAGILNIASEAIISIDESQRMIIFNKGAEKIFGYSQDEAIGQSLDFLLPERFQTVHRNHIGTFANSDITARRMGESKEIYGRRKNGEEFPAEASISKLEIENERIFTVVLRDITDRKQWEETLNEQAIHDALTGLYNRRYFNQRLEEEIARADRNQHSLALLLCDLDHFKTINDNLGHQIGDQVLKETAQIIRESTRGTDLVFRWGGDEMVVILSKTTREGILITSERIRKRIGKISKTTRRNLDLSIGVAMYPEHGRNVDELIRLADRALYIAKKGGDKIHIGEEEYRLTEHSIKVVFQPVIDVGPNQILGYEALSRDPQGKLSIAELFKKYSAIGQLSELKQLCFELQIKVAQEIRLQRLFINVDFDLISRLEFISKPPGMEVILEISELEALHDVENRLKTAKKWRNAGYKFAIDDFGAGFISLPFIASLVPEYIKVDRSTMLHAVSSGKFRRFLKPLLQTLQTYAIEGIIAEGIETEKELKVVKEMGIHLVQGFLLGRPQELNRS